MRVLLGAMTLALALVLIIPNQRLQKANSPVAEAVQILHGLEADLNSGAADEMQRLFPEGYVFTWALYGLAWLQIAEESDDSAFRERAKSEASRALQALRSPKAFEPYPINLAPRGGIFYAAWVARLHGEILRFSTSTEPEQSSQFQADCDAIAQAIKASPTPFLQAYEGLSWPVDTVVAVSVLSLHDRLFSPRYADVIGDWLKEVQVRLDPKTGLIPHRTHPETGERLEGARGSSQALLLRFLADIDRDLAQSHYVDFRHHFLDTHWNMIIGFREYPHGTNRAGDIDSGPLVLGYSGSATVVGMGTSILMGDHGVATSIHRGIEMVGMHTTMNDQKRYAFGQLPVGDAFLVWSKTAHRDDAVFGEELPQGWMWRWHLLSLAVFVFWVGMLANRARLVTSFRHIWRRLSFSKSLS